MYDETLKVIYTFAAAYAAVLLLGLQSLSVNTRHYLLSFCLSTMIGLMNLIVLKTIPNMTDWKLGAAYVAAGPLAIITAIFLHPHLMKLFKRKEHERAKF